MRVKIANASHHEVRTKRPSNMTCDSGSVCVQCLPNASRSDRQFYTDDLTYSLGWDRGKVRANDERLLQERGQTASW